MIAPVRVVLGGLILGIVGGAAACSGGAEGDGTPGPDARVYPSVPPEVDGRITINELMVANALTAFDEHGVAGDWVELHNPTSEDVPIDGYTLTDQLDVPRRGVIGNGVVLPANGHVILWLDAEGGAGGPTHLPFALAKEGGILGFARPDGSYVDRVSYGAQEVDFSAAREPDGAAGWRVTWHVSPGEPNAAGDAAEAGLEDAALPPEEIPPAGDLSERVLGYDALPELALTISDEGIDALLARPREYVQAMITFEGRAYGPVGVRLKGQNSFQPITAKPSFRVNIDEYVPEAKFFGLKDLTLNNMDDDASMLHERLAYRVFREVGLPASRATHARVTVNETFYGLYANVETVRKQMIGRWFADDSGPLYEATDVDFAPSYLAAFELKTGPDDRSLLAGLADALALPSADAAIEAARAHADVAQFVRFWAACTVIGQFDSFPYSVPGDDYLIYADPVAGRLALMPWGMDETFFASEHDVLRISSVFATQCRASPACWQTYADTVWDLLAEFEAMDLEAERLRLIEQIAPFVAMDERKPYTDAFVAELQRDMHWFIKDRREVLGGMLPARSP